MIRRDELVTIQPPLPHHRMVELAHDGYIVNYVYLIGSGWVTVARYFDAAPPPGRCMGTGCMSPLMMDVAYCSTECRDRNIISPLFRNTN